MDDSTAKAHFEKDEFDQLIEQERTVSFFQQFVKGQIDSELVLSAHQLCAQLGQGKNINDVIHLKFAEKHCKKVVTFENDFKALESFSTIEPEIKY